MAQATAIVIAGALIAASIVLTNQWAFGSNGSMLVLLNRWTGAVVVCAPDDQSFPELRCPMKWP